MILTINYPIGTVAPDIRAFSDGPTNIYYMGAKGADNATIAEWYKWLGDKWGVGDPVATEPTADDNRLANIANAYNSGAQKTPEYETKDGERKWVKASTTSKKNPS